MCDMFIVKFYATTLVSQNAKPTVITTN